MPSIDNRTPYSAIDFVSSDRKGVPHLVVCLQATFVLPPANKPADTEPALAEEQPAPPLTDEYFGDAGTSSLRREGQAAYMRPGTDVYVLGRAWAPGEKPATRALVSVRVGSISKRVLVIGDRVWRRSSAGLAPSSPRVFVSMPLRYELAFGGEPAPQDERGRTCAEMNPVGRGLFGSAQQALDQPLPNLEHPEQSIRDWSDRPTAQGLGPIPRSWQPRRALAGTYDDDWVAERAPQWPSDFDERFFCAAAPGMTAYPHLTGGEAVELVGMSPSGPIAFRLPVARLAAFVRFRELERPCPLQLDAVQIDLDEGTLGLVWRASTPVHRLLAQHEVTVLRELAAGEDLT